MSGAPHCGEVMVVGAAVMEMVVVVMAMQVGVAVVGAIEVLVGW